MAANPTGWTSEQLERIGGSTELELASRRSDGTFGRYVTMSVVRVSDDLYVRSAHGPDNPWYRRAIARGCGRIRAGGVDADASFARTDEGVQADIDSAYHAKYDRYGPKIVGTVVGENTHHVTVRLIPTSEPNKSEQLTKP